MTTADSRTSDIDVSDIAIQKRFEEGFNPFIQTKKLHAVFNQLRLEIGGTMVSRNHRFVKDILNQLDAFPLLEKEHAPLEALCI